MTTIKQTNPFYPGNGIEPRYLAGREDIIKDFARSLDVAQGGLPQNIVLYGLRGTGKTVLLRRFNSIASSKNWECIEREFNQRHCDETLFAEAIVTDIVKLASNVSIQSKMKETGKKIVDLLKPDEITAFGVTYKPFYKENRAMLEDHIKDLLMANWPVFKKAGKTGVVFLYDEFQSVRDKAISGAYPISSLLTAIAYAQREGCKYYLALSGLPPLKINLKEARTYAERMFSFDEIDSLNPEQAKAAINGALKGSQYTFDDNLIEAIISETKGYPYFIQFYGYYLIQNTTKAKLDVNDLETLRGSLLKELDKSFFEDRFNLAKEIGKRVLVAMANLDSKELRPVDIQKKAKLSAHSLLQTLRNLQEKGLVYKASRGQYGFSIPLFQQYLQRQN